MEIRVSGSQCSQARSIDKTNNLLKEKYDKRLSVLNEPGAREAIDAMFEARGKLKNPPKAGETF